MGYTLADYQSLADSDLKRGVVDILRVNSWFMDSLSFEPWDALSMQTYRMKTLPSVGTRKLNDTFAESKGTTDSVSDTMALLGGYIDIDKELLNSRSIVDQRALQTQMFTKAFALEFNRMSLYGNPLVYEEEFAGIWYRLVNDLPSSQTILGGGIDVSPDSGTLAADQQTLLEKIDEAIDECDMGTCDALVMNKEMKRRLVAALKAKGQLADTVDAYDRKFPTFGTGGPIIVDIGGTDPLDKTTRIIGNVEADDGDTLTGGDATTIFALKFGQSEYITGFELHNLDVADVGLLENQIEYRIHFDWAVGLYLVNPFSCTRLVGIVAK